MPGQVQYVWLSIIAASAAPLTYVAWLMNPLLLLFFGPDWWFERMARLRPHRWKILFLTFICIFSITIYVIRYT